MIFSIAQVGWYIKSGTSDLSFSHLYLLIQQYLKEKLKQNHHIVLGFGATIFGLLLINEKMRPFPLLLWEDQNTLPFQGKSYFLELRQTGIYTLEMGIHSCHAYVPYISFGGQVGRLRQIHYIFIFILLKGIFLKYKVHLSNVYFISRLLKTT